MFSLIEKQFLTMLVQETHSEEFVANLICLDEIGQRWLLKGFGMTMTEAVEDAEYKYTQATVEWGNFGQIVSEEL